MAYVNNLNTLLVKSETDIFSSSMLQTSIESGSFVSYRPVSVADGSVIEFSIPESDEYFDFGQTQLALRVQITNADGTEMTKDEVMPINDFMSSLFSHVGVELNGKSVSTANNNYHYRSYIEKLLNYSTDAKKSHLGTSLYYPDDAKDFSSIDGTGFTWRNSFVSSDGVIQLMGFIHTEMCNQEKLLLNNVNIRFKFIRNHPIFSLATSAAETTMKDKLYKINIKSAKLIMRRVKLNKNVALAHQLTLNKDLVARYPITRIEVKTITFPKEGKTKTVSSLFKKIGKKIILIIILVSDRKFVFRTITQESLCHDG